MLQDVAWPSWIAEAETRYGRVRYPKNDIVIGSAVATYGEWFEAEVDIFRAFVRPGDCVFDVGANIGLHTLALASLVGRQGLVYAFEPQAELVRLLDLNVQANKLHNVQIYKAFVGAEKRRVRAQVPDYDRPNSSYGSYSILERLIEVPGGDQDEVKVVTLDDTPRNQKLPSFLKIDVEGSELLALQGAVKLIHAARPVIYIENDRVKQSPALVDFLVTAHYRLFWHLAPFFNPNNFGERPASALPIHSLGYAYHKGQIWLNGVALMMLALPNERSEQLLPKLPPGLIEVANVNEHPCHDLKSLQLSANLAGLGELKCLADDRTVQNVDAANVMAKRAVDCIIAGNRASARELFKGALDLDHDNVNIWHSMGVLGEPGFYEAAIAADLRAIELVSRPGSGATPQQIADIYMNHGTHLMRAHRYGEETMAALNKAMETSTKPSGVYHNRGLLYYHRNEADLAVLDLEEAHRLEPDNIWIVNDLAHAVMKNGDLARGLKLMEIRWTGLKEGQVSAIDDPYNPIMTKSHLWRMDVPRWQGEDLTGKTIVFHYEQGSGDTFQFVRYIDTILERYGPTQFLLAGPDHMKRLLVYNFDCEYCIWDNVEDLIRTSRMVDYHCPLLSAVSLLEPTYDNIPTNSAYLKAPFRSEVDYHKGGAKLAVGVVWTPALALDRGMMRLAPVQQFMDLAAVPGVRLWSLQVGIRADDPVKTGCDMIMSDAMYNVKDWADTAAIIDGLDAVVTVDTAVAHLAGAMGKRTFMLNPYVPCWRWCKGPKVWYNSMEMFGQEKPAGFDYTKPIRDIRNRLADMVKGKEVAS